MVKGQKRLNFIIVLMVFMCLFLSVPSRADFDAWLKDNFENNFKRQVENEIKSEIKTGNSLIDAITGYLYDFYVSSKIDLVYKQRVNEMYSSIDVEEKYVYAVYKVRLISGSYIRVLAVFKRFFILPN